MSSTETAKLLKDEEKFSGKDGEDAEEFLESLDEKVLQGRMWDAEILGAVSNVLKGEARRWWRTIHEDVETWTDFKFQFWRIFICEYEEEDLWADFCSRTQAETETITSYLLGLRHIVRHLKYPRRRSTWRYWRTTTSTRRTTTRLAKRSR